MGVAAVFRCKEEGHRGNGDLETKTTMQFKDTTNHTVDVIGTSVLSVRSLLCDLDVAFKELANAKREVHNCLRNTDNVREKIIVLGYEPNQIEEEINFLKSLLK